MPYLVKYFDADGEHNRHAVLTQTVARKFARILSKRGVAPGSVIVVEITRAQYEAELFKQYTLWGD